LSEAQLTEYFSDLIGTHSWRAVKLDLYGSQFFTQHVLKKPWGMPNLIKPPKTQHLPDIVTVAKAQHLFLATRVIGLKKGNFSDLFGSLRHELAEQFNALGREMLRRQSAVGR